MQRIEFDGSNFESKTPFDKAWSAGRHRGIKLDCECGHDISWHGRVSGKCYAHRFRDDAPVDKSEPLCSRKCWKFVEDTFYKDVIEIRERLVKNESL